MKNCNRIGSSPGRPRKLLLVFVLLAVGLLGAVLLIDRYVQQTSARYIMEPEQVPAAEVILVLGAYVFPDGTLSFMLYDRLNEAFDLYQSGKAGKILVSGDHGQMDYDEVNAMKSFLKEKGVPSEDVFMDHAGFNTYESVYRAREVFQAEKIIVVTQGYHLKRAVFAARELGLDAYGVASDRHDYGPVMIKYNLREVAARNQYFFLARYLKPPPTFLGDAIPVSGDGRNTDDR